MKKLLCLCLFAGLGGGALGFVQAGFRTVGIDSMPAACRDYETLTGHPCYQLDLTTATPQDLRDLVGDVAPDVVFTSPPCQAFSGCLPVSVSHEDKYQELSSLAERGLWLVMEAWPDSPPKLVILENVPRIKSRGREWLDNIAKLFNAYGYGWRETTHCCGELGGLAQRRRRFLGVARHHESCGELLFQPPIQRVRGVGEVIGALPVPGSWAAGDGGPMHRLPRLSGMNWLRLALIEAGRDWRALPEAVRLIEGEADPRSTCARREGSLGVTGWDEATHAVIGAASIQNTSLQVADPRLGWSNRAGVYGVDGWDDPSHTIIGAANAYHGASITDPRITCTPRSGVYGVAGWDDFSATIVGAACHDNGAHSVSDPRRPCPTHYLQRADDGVMELVGPPVNLGKQTNQFVIRALDGTWHRPLTTLELAVLQGFPSRIDGGWLRLDGRSHKEWRRRIGNAVPPPTARAIATAMMETLNASSRGELLLSGGRVWVQEEQHLGGAR